MQKVFERADLPAPVAWLDARGGTIVAALQAPPVWRSGTLVPTYAPGRVCTIDPATLAPTMLFEHSDSIRTCRLSSDGARLAVCDFGGGPAPRCVQTWDLIERRRLGARDDDQRVWDAAWLGDEVALGIYDKPWTAEHGDQLELWSADLGTHHRGFRANDAGYDVLVGGRVVLVAGIDVHLWWPDDADRAPFSLGASVRAPPDERADVAVTHDGRYVAASVANRRSTAEVQVQILAVGALDTPPVEIRDDSCRTAAPLAFSTDGRFLAMGLEDDVRVRVHRVADGALVAEFASPGARALAWRDATTLLVGGPTLAAWSVG